MHCDAFAEPLLVQYQRNWKGLVFFWSIFLLSSTYFRHNLKNTKSIIFTSKYFASFFSTWLKISNKHSVNREAPAFRISQIATILIFCRGLATTLPGRVDIATYTTKPRNNYNVSSNINPLPRKLLSITAEGKLHHLGFVYSYL